MQQNQNKRSTNSNDAVKPNGIGMNSTSSIKAEIEARLLQSKLLVNELKAKYIPVESQYAATRSNVNSISASTIDTERKAHMFQSTMLDIPKEKHNTTVSTAISSAREDNISFLQTCDV